MRVLVTSRSITTYLATVDILHTIERLSVYFAFHDHELHDGHGVGVYLLNSTHGNSMDSGTSERICSLSLALSPDMPRSRNA